MTSSSGDNIIFWDDYIDKYEVDYKENGPIVLMYPKNIDEIDNLYGKLLEGSKKLKTFTVYKRFDIPSEYQYSNNVKIGSIILIAEIHYLFSVREGFDKSKVPNGIHGYNNSFPVKRIDNLFF